MDLIASELRLIQPLVKSLLVQTGATGRLSVNALQLVGMQPSSANEHATMALLELIALECLQMYNLVACLLAVHGVTGLYTLLVQSLVELEVNLDLDLAATEVIASAT